MSNLSLSKKGEKFIKEQEGYSAKFYADSEGYPTVGWGTLLTLSKKYTPNTTGYAPDSALSQKEADALAKKLNLDYTSPISKDKAQELLDAELSKCVKAVNDLDFPSGFVLAQSQFDALVSLVFNCGAGVLETNDVKTLIDTRMIYPGLRGPKPNDESEALDACSRLVSKAFSYDRNLKNRRNAEARLFCENMKYTHKYLVYTL